MTWVGNMLFATQQTSLTCFPFHLLIPSLSSIFLLLFTTFHVLFFFFFSHPGFFIIASAVYYKPLPILLLLQAFLAE